MTLEEIRAAVDGKFLAAGGCPESKIAYAFATDMLSDTLFLIRRDTDSLLLISGVTNPSVVRTAVILDIPAILIVRGKTVPEETIQAAKERGISLLHTRHIMFSSCGILYKAGLKGAPCQI